MKKLTCQIWLTDQGNHYSIHLNDKQRLRVLNKNIRKYEAADVSEHYSCEVEDDVYEEVMQNQIRHGLMTGGDPPQKPQSNMDRYANWAISSIPGVTPEWKNITIQFQELSDTLNKMEIMIDGEGIKVIEVDDSDGCD